MTTALQLRRGTTAQHATFVGANGEVTVDTNKKTLVVNDGVTQGGTPLAREDALTKFVRHDTAAQGLTGTQQGNVRTNIGLGNVNNTSDVNKPVSTATQAALAGKLDKTGGTLTGALTLPGDASSALQAVPKQQVENLINAALPSVQTSAYIGGRGQVFTSSGTFTVPDGVTAVKVRGCSGGGGATGSSSNGGTTSFGSYCSATGGISGPNGGTGGVATGGDINIDGGVPTLNHGGLCGGSGLLGGRAEPSPATGYGNGGFYNGSHGGGGGYFEKYITGLTPGDTITVTIGAGGDATSGAKGTPGICVVEW